MTGTTQAIAARPKTTLVLLLVVAFLCGAATGAVGMRRVAFRAAQNSVLKKRSKEMTLERWREKLDLTDDQVSKLSLILNDFDKYYDNVLAEGHERILQVLTADQRSKFERMVHER